MKPHSQIEAQVLSSPTVQCSDNESFTEGEGDNIDDIDEFSRESDIDGDYCKDDEINDT